MMRKVDTIRLKFLRQACLRGDENPSIATQFLQDLSLDFDREAVLA
jgi:hypothetical protein